MAEFTEETLLGSVVHNIGTAGVYRDDPTNTIDICYEIEIDCEVPDLKPSCEYTTLEWVCLESIPLLLASNKYFVPASRRMLESISKSRS